LCFNIITIYNRYIICIILTVEAPTHSTTLSHDLTSDRESSQLSQLNAVPPHQDNSNIATPHYNVSVEKTMDNLMHSTKVPYLIDSVVAAPHQNIPATVVVRQTVSLSTRSDEPFKSKLIAYVPLNIHIFHIADK